MTLMDGYRAQDKFLWRLDRFGTWVGEHFFPCLLLQTLICWGFDVTGADGLEPAILGWFWGPIIALFTSGVLSGYVTESYWGWKWSYWIRSVAFQWRGELFVFLWLFNSVILQWIIWKYLIILDLTFAHPLRDAVGNVVGKLFGLAGQNGFFLFFSVLFAICTLIAEIYGVSHRNHLKKQYHSARF